MFPRITFTRSLAFFLAVGCLTAEPAVSHVTLEAREARAGTTYKAVLKVPHGCDGAATLKVRALIPDGVIAVKPMPKPGWQVETVKAPYGRAYAYFHGQQLSDGVKEIVWSGGKLADDHYDEFVFSSFIAGEMPAGRIYFPVTQTCESGEARWADIPAAGQDAHNLKAPAPALTILAQHSGHAAKSDSKSSNVFKSGALVIETPWARATPGGAKVAGGYMKITNTGSESDRLTGGSVPFAARFEVHEMSMDGGMMKMRQLADGLEIKPGQSVELKPGGYHVMFMDLKQGLKEGQTVKGELIFEKAGRVAIEYRVGPIGGGAPGGHAH